MNEYLLSVTGTVLLAAFVSAIVPDGKTSGIVKAVAKSVCLLAVIAPIPKYLQSGQSDENAQTSQGIFSQSVIETDGEFIQYYSEMRVRAAAQRIQREVYDEFCISCEIALEWRYEKDLADILITKITVAPPNGVEESVMINVCEYLTKNYCSEVLIE